MQDSLSMISSLLSDLSGSVATFAKVLSKQSRVMLFLFCILTSCEKATPSPYHWQTFAARDDGLNLEKVLLYHAKVPIEWVRKDPTGSIVDTMKPICEFMIEDQLRLTIHTFPITDQRIPPEAQVQRWMKQFEKIDPLSISQTPISHSGFSGLFLEAQGLLNGKEQKMLAWSLHLAHEYETKLHHERLKKADYTLKIVGMPEQVERHRPAIITFVQSFELTDELSAPL